MHEHEAAAQGLTCLYQLIDLDEPGRGPDALPELLPAAEKLGFRGLNITHPCKQAVLPLLTDLSDDARALGAVNTVVFESGKRIGYNTDWIGFSESLSRCIPDTRMTRVVQLGAGGAGAATAYAALMRGAEHVSIFDVEPTRADALVHRMANLFGWSRVSATTDLAESLSTASGLIHATPTGMDSHPGLPLPISLIRRELWVAEVVYFPLETELLRAARAAGCLTVDGSGMAVGQAEAAFQLFTGLVPDSQRMHRCFLECGASAKTSRATENRDTPFR